MGLIAPALVQLRHGNRVAYEKSIRNNETKKTTFSNNEIQQEAEKAERIISEPSILKTDKYPQLEPHSVGPLSMDNFKVGIETNHD